MRSELKIMPKIIDDFFEAPLLWREYALKQEFKCFENTPDLLRTDSLDRLDLDVFQSLAHLLIKHIPGRNKFENLFSYFRLANREFEEGYLPPRDLFFNMAGTIFLNIESPVGTGLSLCEDNLNLESTVQIENRYNRCILYPISQIAKHEKSFGKNEYDSRLTIDFFGRAI